VKKTKFHEYLRHKILTNNCRTDHIPAIDSMCTTVFWRPPWILRD